MFFKHLEEDKKDQHPKLEDDKSSVDAMDINRDDTASAKSKDLRDEFRNGLKDAGLDVKAEEGNEKEEIKVKEE